MDESTNVPESDATTRRDVLKLGGLTALGTVVAGSLATSGAASASLKNAAVSLAGTTALKQNHFAVEMDGVAVVQVHTVDIETDSLATDATSPPTNTVTLSRDFSNTSEWYKWRKAVLDGKVDRRSISVIFHNDAGQESGRMNFFNCWPSKWVGPSLNAKNSGHATEKIEISWETVEMK